MNDTVVIFDRVRENLRKYSDIKIYELTNISINETLSRTLITSITTLLALFSIFFFGGEILKGFSLAMIFGVIFGTYSSIYIANTVLVRLNVSQKTILKEDKWSMLIYIKLFEVLFPVFFVVGIGYYLGKKNPKIDTTFITNFAANVGTPAMIIYALTVSYTHLTLPTNREV